MERNKHGVRRLEADWQIEKGGGGIERGENCLKACQ
jgi:hypothetical protein